MDNIKHGAEAKKEVESFSQEPSKLKLFANGCARAISNFASNKTKAIAGNVKKFANDKDANGAGSQMMAGGMLWSAAVVGAIIAATNGIDPSIAKPVIGATTATGVALIVDTTIACAVNKRSLLQQALTLKKSYEKAKKVTNKFIDKMVQKGR